MSMENEKGAVKERKLSICGGTRLWRPKMGSTAPFPESRLGRRGGLKKRPASPLTKEAVLQSPRLLAKAGPGFRAAV